jgi:hypothetical protein
MTNEQIQALEAVPAASVAARTTGLINTEIYKAGATGPSYPEAKSGRPPINYNPIDLFLNGTRRKAHDNG